jgi:transcriptional regulator with XRE-family HTH domain
MRVEHKEEMASSLPTPEQLAGEEVRRLRKGRGWSQDDVARRMSAAGFTTWHQSTVGRTETAERPLRLNESVALAGLFGVSLTRLLEPIRMSVEEIDEEIRAATKACADARCALAEAQAMANEVQYSVHEARVNEEHAANRLGSVSARLDSLQGLRDILTGNAPGSAAARLADELKAAR